MTPEMIAKIEAMKAKKLAETQQAAAEDDPALAKVSAELQGTTGAVSPPHAAKPEVQPAGALSITTSSKPELKSVEEIDVDPLAKLRIFRSRIPGSSFVMRAGYTVYFTHGWYETTDPAEIEQLDAVANKVPTIYTEEHEADIVEAVLAARREGFVGSVGDAMAQQLSVEQRLAALRAAGRGPAPALRLPTLVPEGAGLTASSTTAADASKMDAALQAAIRASQNAAQSNS